MGRGDILLKIPGGGGVFWAAGAGGRGAGRVFAGNLGGGGAKYFFSGPKFPPSVSLSQKDKESFWNCPN